MPKYRYRCDDCGGTFLLVQKINDNPETNCLLTIKEEVGSEDDVRCMGTVKRIPSAGGFVLNGKGWFKDGY